VRCSALYDSSFAMFLLVYVRESLDCLLLDFLIWLINHLFTKGFLLRVTNDFLWELFEEIVI